MTHMKGIVTLGSELDQKKRMRSMPVVHYSHSVHTIAPWGEVERSGDRTVIFARHGASVLSSTCDELRPIGSPRQWNNVGAHHLILLLFQNGLGFAYPRPGSKEN
jgi:hypothetical protein